MFNFVMGTEGGAEDGLFLNSIFDLLKKRSNSNFSTTFRENDTIELKKLHLFNINNFEDDDVKELEKLIRISKLILMASKNEQIK